MSRQAPGGRNGRDHGLVPGLEEAAATPAADVPEPQPASAAAAASTSRRRRRRRRPTKAEWDVEVGEDEELYARLLAACRYAAVGFDRDAHVRAVFAHVLALRAAAS